jgi:uncharacterized DUF497 family protein
MQFEWDENKSLANELKHGIDFHSATKLWNDEERIEIHTAFPDERRKILIGRIDEKIWACVFTLRKGTVRIISARRARKKEAALYEQEKQNR